MVFKEKKSIREEFDLLKLKFEKLLSEKKITKEIQVLIQSMFMLFELVLAIFMEKTTKKNNKNSSKPSSQTQKDETSTTYKGSKSKGNNQNGNFFTNTRTTETIEIAIVDFCENCDEDLRKIKCQQHERRTKIDIIFEKIVKHVDAEIKKCPRCQTITKGKFPVDMHGPLQYGIGIKAFILNLLIAQMISLNRIQKLIKTLIGNVISEAVILKYVMQLYLALDDWEKSSIEKLLTMPSIHVDETSIRVNKKKHYIHSYSYGDITLQFLQPGRGIVDINNIGIIPRYTGAIIHDCLQAYLSYTNCNHGLCGSHLLRELQFIIDSNGYIWAKNMKQLLQETCDKVSKCEEKKLSEIEYKKLQKRYRNILTRGEKELPPIPPRQNGKRGKIAKSDAHNLWERFKNLEQGVLLFARDSNVSFTNNRAERDLRMNKVKQKVSGCFRTEQFAKAHCRISGYLKTMSYKGYNPLVAIEMALSAQIYTEMGE